MLTAPSTHVWIVNWLQYTLHRPRTILKFLILKRIYAFMSVQEFRCNFGSKAIMTSKIRFFSLFSVSTGKLGTLDNTHVYKPIFQAVAFFYNMHMIHVYRLLFQGGSKIWGYKNDNGHLEGLGEHWEQHPVILGQVLIHFLRYAYNTC